MSADEALLPAREETPMAEIPQEINDAVKTGHALEYDPPAALTAAQRWTCTTCGDAVLRYGTNVYGGATERTCAESLEFWAVGR